MQTKSGDFSWILVITGLLMLSTDAAKNGNIAYCAERDRCMSTWECRTLNGISVSVCLMGYVFGACCRLPLSDTTFAAPISVNSTQSLKRPEGVTSECPTNCTTPPGVIVEPSFNTRPNDGTFKTTTVLNVERDDHHYFQYVTRYRPYTWTRRPTLATQYQWTNKLNDDIHQNLPSASATTERYKVEMHNVFTESAIGSLTTDKVISIKGDQSLTLSSSDYKIGQPIRNQTYLVQNKTKEENNNNHNATRTHYNYNHKQPSSSYIPNHQLHHHQQEGYKPNILNNSVIPIINPILETLQQSLSSTHLGITGENNQNTALNTDIAKFPDKNILHHAYNNFHSKPIVVTRRPVSDFSKFPYFNFLPPRKPPKYQLLTTSKKPVETISVTDAPEEVNWNKVDNFNVDDYQKDTTQIFSHEFSSSFGPTQDSSKENPASDLRLTTLPTPLEHDYNKATTEFSSPNPTIKTEHFKIPVTHFFHQLFITSTPSSSNFPNKVHATSFPKPSENLKTTVVTVNIPPVSTSITTVSDVKPSDYKKECGVRPLAFDGRVVGGSPSTFGQWPWQVLVKEVPIWGFFSKNKCGGVLISRLYVLTAAHCRPGFLKKFTVILGEHDLTSEQEILPVIERKVRLIHAHPDFVVSTYENDVALLELEKPVDFELHIVPICLPAQGQDFTGKIGVASGFGRLSYEGRHVTVLHHVSVPILSRRQCQEYFAASRYKVSVKDSYLCAGNKEGGKDSCEGDSGGPLAVEGADGRWVLAGIVSNGIKCALPNSPGIYTKISNFVDWIKKKIS